MHPRERYIWVQIRILHETEKAKNSIFEIYVKEDVVG